MQNLGESPPDSDSNKVIQFQEHKEAHFIPMPLISLHSRFVFPGLQGLFLSVGSSHYTETKMCRQKEVKNLYLTSERKLPATQTLLVGSILLEQDNFFTSKQLGTLCIQKAWVIGFQQLLVKISAESEVNSSL
ncbi:hypothetical protein ABPG74_004949 [Tetrahymena malaccensis]